MRFINIFLITLIISFTILMSFVQGLMINENITFEDGSYEYITNSEINVSSINTNITGLYINETEYCDSSYKNYFNTTRNCSLSQNQITGGGGSPLSITDNTTINNNEERNASIISSFWIFIVFIIIFVFFVLLGKKKKG